jgi:flagellar basal body P-ring formation protein FlgA
VSPILNIRAVTTAAAVLVSLLIPSGLRAQTAAKENGLQSQIQRAAEASLRQAFPEQATHLEVRVTRMSDGLPLEEALEIVWPSAAGIPKARVQANVALAGSKVGWALLYVAHYDSVVVSRNRLDMDAELSEGDLTVSWMETTRFHGTPLLARDLRAMRRQGAVYAARLIQADRALRSSDLRPAYAADTGDLVLMDYNRGIVRLRLSCKAREPGAVGDTIRLYAPDTDTNYRARLTAPGQAEWLETL